MREMRKKLLVNTLIVLFLTSILVAGVSAGSSPADWWTDILVYQDDTNYEGRPSIATDSNAYLYVAYQHYDSGYERYRIYISKSIDGGLTWSLFYKIEKTTSLMNPSVAIDPHDNRIYVAYENEISPSDHDILVSTYTPGVGWIERTIECPHAGDDRYPTIVSDYQFGSSNCQYVVYEHIWADNNRDFNVAKSIDHGNSWDHWHDWYYGWESLPAVRTQTSITTSQDGHVYVAYVFNGELCVQYGDRSSTDTVFENQLNLYDILGISGAASWPSIAASHGDPNFIVMVWQRYISPVDDDVCYAYTTDRGVAWYWGNISSSGYNERFPAITVDGQGSTSYVAGYFHVAYYYGLFTHYKRAYHTNPTSWSEYPGRPNPISHSSGTGANTHNRSISITTQTNNGGWWPNVVWTDGRGTSYDLYYTTPDDNPIIPEFPTLVAWFAVIGVATLVVILGSRKFRGHNSQFSDRLESLTLDLKAFTSHNP
jgi:hypothetical protein